jgi:hypothetical protein
MESEKVKEIEEMASDMNFACVELSKEQRLEIARVLINLDYCQRPEGSIVLNAKDIETTCKHCRSKYEKIIEELEEQRDRQAYIAEDLIQEKHRWTEQARREIAEIIIHDLEVKVAQYAMVLDLPELPEKLRFIPTEVMVHFVKTLKEHFVEEKQNED